MGVASLFIILAICSGCSFRTTVINDPISAEHVAFMVRAQTSRTEVLQKLGAPQDIVATSTHDLYRYRYLVQKTFRISFGTLTRGFVPLTISRGHAGLEVFEVQFDAGGIVQEFAFKHSADTARFNPWPF